MSDTERIERIRKDPDEVLNYIRDLEAEVRFKKEVIAEQTGNINRLQAEVERLAKLGAERDAATNLLRSCFVRLPSGNLKLRRTIQAFLDNADTGPCGGQR